MKETTVKECKIIDIKKISSSVGNLSVVENFRDIPFEIKRVYYLYDIPGGEERGGHAHKELEQLIISASGSFDVVVKDGREERVFNLNRSYYGLLLKPGLWRELKNFSTSAVALVLASEIYKEEDYIRDYNEFLKYKGLL